MNRIARIAAIASLCVIGGCAAGTAFGQGPKPVSAQNSTPAQNSPPAQKPAQAQTPTQQPGEGPVAPAARPQDVDTIPHLLQATYEVISGPAGPRDWDRFRSLFYRDARLSAVQPGKDGGIVVGSVSVDRYAQFAGAYFAKNGFFENGVANRVEQWDHIATVWSTYESRHAKGEKPFARGINSFQLFNDGHRWWVVSIYWQEEEPGHPIPDIYLWSD